MESHLRIFYLLKLRSEMNTKALRNYGLYFAALILIAYIATSVNGQAHQLLMTAMVLSTLYCAERLFFPQVKETMNSLHFLTVPAHSWEKWLSEFLYTFIAIPVIAILPIIFAIFVANIISPPGNMLHLKFFDIKSAFLFYWVIHPLLFFGAIYFKNSVLVKTFGSIALLALASFLFVGLEVALLSKGHSIDFGNIEFQVFGQHTQPFLSYLHSLIQILYFPFFWGLSYLAFIEVER